MNKRLVILVIVFALSLISINTVVQAKVFSNLYLQTTSLPTLSLTPTSAPSSTPTATFVVTPTPTFTPTLSYPSVQDIKKGLTSDFGEIKDLLQVIKQKVEPQTFNEKIRDDFISNFLWDFFGNPMVAGIFAFIGSLSVVGKVLVKLKIKRDVSNGRHPNETDKKLDSIFEVVNAVFVLLLVAFSLAFALNFRSSSASINQNDFSIISQKLENIDNRLQNFSPLVTPTPTKEQKETANYWSNINSALTLGLFLSVLANVMLISIYSKKGKTNDVTEIQIASQKNPTIPFEKELLPAIFLSLIWLLLPYPADVLILPFILQHFISAFFGIITVYSNKDIKTFVIKHFVKILYLAQFGAWFGFLNALQEVLRPSWSLVERIFPRDYSQPFYIWFESSWDFFPLVIALILAIPGWVYLKRVSKDKFIPKIKASLSNAK